VVSSVSFSGSRHLDNDLEPIVQLNFPVRGTYLPADHSYGLFAASVNLVPQIRSSQQISILSIPGIPDIPGRILLTKQSCLRIRVSVSQIPLVYKLATKKITIGIHEIYIGIPKIYVPKPTATLRSRIVTVKGYTKPKGFLEAVQRQLHNLGISGTASIPNNQEGHPARKTIKIQRFTIIGFTTEITNLSDADSLLLQAKGLGGKRHMGCGIFLPKR